MKYRKGVALPVEFLIRVLIAIFLVIIIFNIGKEAGKYIFASIFGTDLEQHFNEFVDELNKPLTPDIPSKQVFVILDSNTAIIGFSTLSQSFRCFGCGTISTDVSSFFDKPDNGECKDKSCVCLCTTPLYIPRSKTPYKMTCSKIKCKSLNKELAEVVELKNYIEKLGREEQRDYQYLRNAKWVGGFLFEKHSRGDFVSNGVPQPPGNRFTVYVNKESSESNVYVAVCPGAECKYTFKQQVGLELPPEICAIMYDCSNQQSIKGVSDITGTPEKYCRYDRPVTRYHSKEDCEKVKACAQSNPKVKAGGKCEDRGTLYELSFMQT